MEFPEGGMEISGIPRLRMTLEYGIQYNAMHKFVRVLDKYELSTDVRNIESISDLIPNLVTN